MLCGTVTVVQMIHHQVKLLVRCLHFVIAVERKDYEEVYIYIIQSGIEKEIAYYDDDENATVIKGVYVWNEMEIQ